MSGKGKTSSNASATAKGNKASTIFTKLKEIMKLCRELEEEGLDLKSYDDMRSEVAQLKAEVAKKGEEVKAKEDEVSECNKIIAGLRAENAKISVNFKTEKAQLSAGFKTEKDAIVDAFEERAVQRAGDRDTIESQQKRIEDLTKKKDDSEANAEKFQKLFNTTEADCEKAKGELRIAQDQGKRLEAENRIMKDRVEVTQIELRTALSSVAKLEEETNIVKLDEADLTSKLLELSTGCHALVKKYFYSDKPADPAVVLKSKWSDILSQENIIYNRFTRLVMHDPTGCMSMAAAEAIICQELCAHIFKPYYVLHSKKTEDLLEGLAQKDARREAILRCQLVSASPEGYAHDLASGHATGLARSMADTSTSHGWEFCEDLVKLFCQAASIWQRVQCSEVRVVAKMLTRKDGGDESWDEWTDKITDYDNLVQLTEDQAESLVLHDEAVVTLFPRILHGNSVLHHGAALWMSQDAAVAANCAYIDREKRVPGSPRAAIAMTNGARRRSSNATKEPLRHSDTSSEASTARQRSFTDHLQSNGQSLHATLRSSRNGRDAGSPTSLRSSRPSVG